jgi:hypothetical protein
MGFDTLLNRHSTNLDVLAFLSEMVHCGKPRQKLSPLLLFFVGHFYSVLFLKQSKKHVRIT